MSDGQMSSKVSSSLRLVWTELTGKGRLLAALVLEVLLEMVLVLISSSTRAEKLLRIVF